MWQKKACDHRAGSRCWTLRLFAGEIWCFPHRSGTVESAKLLLGDIYGHSHALIALQRSGEVVSLAQNLPVTGLKE